MHIASLAGCKRQFADLTPAISHKYTQAAQRTPQAPWQASSGKLSYEIKALGFPTEVRHLGSHVFTTKSALLACSGVWEGFRCGGGRHGADAQSVATMAR